MCKCSTCQSTNEKTSSSSSQHSVLVAVLLLLAASDCFGRIIFAAWVADTYWRWIAVLTRVTVLLRIATILTLWWVPMLARRGCAKVSMLVCGRMVPLGLASGLVQVVVSLAVLVPLL